MHQEPTIVFQHFIDALIGLLAHPATPDAARTAFTKAALEFAAVTAKPTNASMPDGATVGLVRQALLKAFAVQLANNRQQVRRVTGGAYDRA